jgi:general secretion pathway protein I
VSRSWIDAAPGTGAAAARRRRGGDGAAVAAGRARGFSMLEVLVAFVILALVGTALFRLFSGALNNASAADDYSRAVLVGESVLAEAAGTRPLREAAQSGSADDGRIEWTTRVTPYVAPQVNPDTETGSELLPTRLWRVVAEVRFAAPNGKPRTLTLATERIGAKEPQ